MRDFEGQTVFTLLLETKVYQFLQLRVIESAIRTLWLGKSNYGGKLMQNSISYQTLYSHSKKKKVD